MTEQTTKSQAQAADIAALLRARTPLLWIVTREESRVESYIAQACAAAGYVPRFWDAAAGITDVAGEALPIGGLDPMEALSAIRDRAKGKADAFGEGEPTKRGAWIMRDFHIWVDGPAMAQVCRMVRNLARTLPTVPRDYAQALIVLSPSANVPLELQGHATVIDWPLPDRAEIGAILDRAVEPYSAEQIEKPTNGTRDSAIEAAIGLSGEETQATFARSLVQFRKIDAPTIANEKKRVIARERVLEWYDPIPGGLEAIGGLENLKSWLLARRVAFTVKARQYGLPTPKGLVIVGVSGCGKSLTAKAIPTAFGCPLLRFDMGALKGSLVGESEKLIRKAIKLIDTVGRCVVWLDEIEKALQGATSGANDGGVSADALGVILNWMQERSGQAFVVATANDISKLPPELLRKGRFDELFFVDLPHAVERLEIIRTALRANNRGAIFSDIGADLHLVVSATEGFTGSEIAALVPEAMFSAFADGERELTVTDLLAAARATVPLSKTAGDKIDALRAWAKGKARPATAPLASVTDTTARPESRVVDLEIVA